MTDRKPWRLKELSLPDVKATKPNVAVLPWGATEPHGMHLPYGTDIYEIEAVADRAGELAHQKGANLVVLPAIPYGVQTNQQGFPLSMNVNPSTQFRILSDLTDVLEHSGVEKFVVLNGHGGNDFYGHLRELYPKHKMLLVQVHWYDLCQDLYARLFPKGGDHAHDMESSMMLHLHAHLVDMQKAGPQTTAKSSLAGFNEGWAKTPRPWHTYTRDSGAGDPRDATSEKGKQFVDAVTETFAEFLVGLSKTPREKLPF